MNYIYYLSWKRRRVKLPMEFVGKAGSGDSEKYGARRQGREGCAVRMYNICESTVSFMIFLEYSRKSA